MRARKQDLSYGAAAGSIAAAVVASAVVIFTALGGGDIMAALRRSSGAIMLALLLGLLMGAVTHTFRGRRDEDEDGTPRGRRRQPPDAWRKHQEQRVPITKDVRSDLTGLRRRLRDMGRRPPAE